MASDLKQKCEALAVELGFGSKGRIVRVEPLTGGVASDIAVVDLGDRKICAKFALPKLKVAEDWRAPVHRNRAEYEWLRFASRIVPESALQLLGCSDVQNGFAMEFIEGDDVSLWKSELLSGSVDRSDAARVGDVLGRIHQASSLPDFDTSPFQNCADFHSLRIEPYILFTATRWPRLAGPLNEIARTLSANDRVLVHGDVSPKNILFRDGRPILLDAECATMGDAGFDGAFCLNHLILKAVHVPGSRAVLFESVFAFWNSYAAHVTWASELERRICRLLPALMLARVDGKSPVEYLTDAERETVRALSVPLIENPSASLSDLVRRLAAELEEMTA